MYVCVRVCVNPSVSSSSLVKCQSRENSREIGIWRDWREISPESTVHPSLLRKTPSPVSLDSSCLLPSSLLTSTSLSLLPRHRAASHSLAPSPENQVKLGNEPSSSKPGRNAMTLVRGNIYMEPLELAGASACAGGVRRSLSSYLC